MIVYTVPAGLYSVLTPLSSDMLHSSETDTGHVQGGHWQLEGERLVEHRVTGPLDQVCPLALHHLALLHQAHLHIEVCNTKTTHVSYKF